MDPVIKQSYDKLCATANTLVCQEPLGTAFRIFEWPRSKDVHPDTSPLQHILFRTRAYRDRTSAVFKVCEALEYIIGDIRPEAVLFIRHPPEVEHVRFVNGNVRYRGFFRISYSLGGYDEMRKM